ncbi:MAG: dephospho-CoA kinase [Endomicrobium sp.]|jgi:dephospho-CoA kinase|uniref:AAA family ATPase n=1 Tax=Candidatus Endomicrobiellum cubanum TaxID=3242325 RepID=UPI002831E7D6|nr:dephospho-CoA kinase [Endomicrobium sp.]MDR2395718.1 dephospho-CoA kinase [Endomicrobium sp.]
MIIGLTGSYCSGKDTVAEYISQKHGYIHFSLSDVIRETMQENAIELTRQNLIVFGTNLRKENGNGILAKKVLDKIDLYGKYCVTSIRHPEEVNELRERKDFVLVNVDAPQKVRFERMQKRKRCGDPQTLEKFIELEKQESQSDGSGQQLIKTAKLADITIINDSDDMHTLESRVDELLKNINDK